MYQYFSFVSSDSLGTLIIDFFKVQKLENQLLITYECPKSLYQIPHIFPIELASRMCTSQRAKEIRSFVCALKGSLKIHMCTR